jgi:hypothetical protein
MRKHNSKFATSVGRAENDCTNHPQSFAHSYANNKMWQLHANALLRKLLAPFMPKRAGASPAQP